LTRRRLLLVLAGAAALAAALVTASQLGARDTQRPAAASSQSGLFAGIPQRGLVLGRNDAPVTLVEYADLQCPYCAEWTARTLPTLVKDYVRRGKLRIDFRGLAFIGPDSDVALRAAIAAGRDNLSGRSSTGSMPSRVRRTRVG
jgi:protein-disulfide isomerase